MYWFLPLQTSAFTGLHLMFHQHIDSSKDPSNVTFFHVVLVFNWQKWQKSVWLTCLCFDSRTPSHKAFVVPHFPSPPLNLSWIYLQSHNTKYSLLSCHLDLQWEASSDCIVTLKSQTCKNNKYKMCWWYLSLNISHLGISDRDVKVNL